MRPERWFLVRSTYLEVSRPVDELHLFRAVSEEQVTEYAEAKIREGMDDVLTRLGEDLQVLISVPFEVEWRGPLSGGDCLPRWDLIEEYGEEE